jgi:formate dehydrogenase iron-sulfur subunit
MSARKISRRDFLKTVGIGGATATAAWLVDGKVGPAYASSGSASPALGMLIDLIRCVGCNSCALACKESNGLPRPDVAPDGLATDVYTFVEERTATRADGQVVQRFVKRQCMHCLNAACVAACPAAAMYKGEQGQVIYRAYRCLGCRYCQAACPFGVPRFNWDDGIDPVISKCQLCYARSQAGQQPACVSACPSGALRLGEREDLLAQAHARIASNPGRYVDHVFGEFEVGGTAMLYLSDVPFEQLGFPTSLPRTAPPEETHKIISKLPFVLTGMTALMAGTAAYTHRQSSDGEEE